MVCFKQSSVHHATIFDKQQDSSNKYPSKNFQNSYFFTHAKKKQIKHRLRFSRRPIVVHHPKSIHLLASVMVVVLRASIAKYLPLKI